MDILNFISWIKAGNYRESLPTDVPNLLAIGSKDPSRDDSYLPIVSSKVCLIFVLLNDINKPSSVTTGIKNV